MTTNINNEHISLPPQTTTTVLEQTSTDDLDGLQPSSLPSPPRSNVETVEPKLWLLRPPPFPPPGSSSSSTNLYETPVSFEDLEQFVENTTTASLTGASSSNHLPRSAAAAIDSQIPDALLLRFADDDFTFDANDFPLFGDDDPGPISPPTSPHSLFPSYDTH